MSTARRFESCRTHVKEEREEAAEKPVVLIEDGNTFLSQGELDDYREQKVMLAWQEGMYV